MPRKKNAVVAPEASPIPEAPATPAPSPKPSRRRAPKTPTVEPTPAPVVEVAPVPAEKPKRPSRKKVAEPVASVAVEPEVVPVVAPEPVAAPKPARPSRSRKPKAATPEPVVAPTPVVVAPEPVAKTVAETPKSRSQRNRGRNRGKSETPTETVVAAEVAPVPIDDTPFDPTFDYASLTLPTPTFRPRSKPSTAKVEAVAAEVPETVESPVVVSEDASTDAKSDDDRKGRRRRRRRGGRRQDDEREATAEAEADDADEEVETPVAVAPVAPEKPAAVKKSEPKPESKPEPVAEVPKPEFPRRDRTAPKPPTKAMIPIPSDAPQVVVREGVPTLVRSGRVYPPVFFFGSPADERRAATVMEEVRMAAESGVHVHSYLIDFDVDTKAVDDNAALAAYLLAQSVATDPESQVVFRISFQAPRGWEEKYPDGRYRTADGHTAEPSVCDDAFWDEARTCLERFIKSLRLLDLKNHILGLHLERGEWFLPSGNGYDTSKAALRAFRAWTRTRYVDDEVTLRASWFDGAARFDTLTIPQYNPEGTDGERFIRASRKQRQYVDYHLFLSDATVSRIADLAYAAKAASEGYFLLGVSYGYTFEWSHPDSGHLSLGKLLRTPEIDFIAGPPSYRTREPGGSAPFPGPIDSFALNGKLFISEEDYKTSLSTGHEPDDFNPRLKTPQALDSVHWRGAGAALAHGSGIAWMDVWGNGWLKTHSVWERARKVLDATIDRMAAPLGDPEVAVFIDERALAYLVDSNAFALLVQNVRESILRAGVSAGFYLLSDLQHREVFPEAKLYLFLNAWDVRPELRSAIKTRLQRNGKVLFWLYAAGLFDAGRHSLERAREVTGIALKPQPYYSRSGTTILNRRHPLSEAFPDRSVVGSSKLEPSYFAIPEGATVLGEYTQTGLPSFVVKEFNEGPAETHWTSVFLGEPLVNAALIRALAQMAGAHVWNFHEDVVHVRPPFCTVHCGSAGPRTLTLPTKYSAYNLLTNEWAAVDTANLRFSAVEGSTHCFLIGPKDDLDSLVRNDPATLLRMDELPPRDNNVREDVSNFDVPIMRLDEWIEGGDTDDNADEWFLRPAKVEEELPAPAVETPERVGRRRRRRRGGRDRNDEREPEVRGTVETVSIASTDPALDDFGLNVMFRKRE